MFQQADFEKQISDCHDSEVFFFISQGLTNMHTRTTVVSAAEANCLNVFFFFLDMDPMLLSKLLALDFVTFSV